MKRLCLLHSTIRADEKLILQAAKDRNIDVSLVDIRNQVYNPDNFSIDFDVALERSVSTVKGDYAILFLESLGVPVVNSSAIVSLCENKFLTSLKLAKKGVSTPKFALAFSEKQTKEIVDQLGGYPVVLKPTMGSWGRLLSKINDADALETIIEHKEVLGGPQQKVYYFQQFVNKPGRDIRAFVIGGKTICAIYRDSEHWITNTARGGKARNCPVTKELAEICEKTSDAVGGGILAMDVFETDDGFSINEINHTMEFKNSEQPTGVSISGAIVDYCITLAQQKKEKK
jgi:[lysine-biosynthesis-protein LysW]---L-2-aminoadipate ligase